MNKRKEQKELTRKRILKSAKEEFSINGFINTSTASIAKKTGIAHGTLFLHFPTKENLVMEIIDSILLKVTEDLGIILETEFDINNLMDKYLDYLIEEENFFSVIARELPFYQEELRRKIFFREGAVRKYFYSAYELGIENGKYKEVDITSALTFFFGTVNYLLANKKSFVKNGSVIALKKELFIDTFNNLITI